MPADPIARFRRWFADAERTGMPLPEAIALATADRRGRPSVRYVLLKHVDARGFVFFTDGRSRKGGDIAANPEAAFAVYWDALGKQVRVEGRVAMVSPVEADAYWATRPRESRLAASVSHQSATLARRSDLLSRWRALGRRHTGARRAAAAGVDGLSHHAPGDRVLDARRLPPAPARALRAATRRRGSDDLDHEAPAAMSALDYAALAAELGPAELHVIERPELAFTAVIALDDLRLGPACGGIRWRAYPAAADGVRDVLRLARAMTFKNSFAELGFGGGKAVVLKDPAMEPVEAFPLLGEVIESLGGPLRHRM